MTKDGIDIVDLARESSGTRSEANAALGAKQSLALGDRVRMSALGRGRHPRYGDFHGLIVGRGSPNSWRVKFDERKCVFGAGLDRHRRARVGSVPALSSCMTARTHCSGIANHPRAFQSCL
jgi:hypothetical protein